MDPIIPDEYRLTKEECIGANISARGINKPCEIIPSNRTLYNGPLAVLNNLQPIALLSFYNNSAYERDLITILNNHQIKSISLMKNLWIIYQDDICKNNAMYILSLFTQNSIDQEVTHYLQHLFKYSDYEINPYDYINGLMFGHPIDEIRGHMLQKYITKMNSQKLEDLDTIFFDSDRFNSFIDCEHDHLMDSYDIILFDAIFNYVSIECRKLMKYLFSESTIFTKFVKSNDEKIGKLPHFRLKVDVPIIDKLTLLNLLEPPPKNNNNNYNNNNNHGRRGRKNRRNRNGNQNNNKKNFNLMKFLGY